MFRQDVIDKPGLVPHEKVVIGTKLSERIIDAIRVGLRLLIKDSCQKVCPLCSAIQFVGPRSCRVSAVGLESTL